MPDAVRWRKVKAHLTYRDVRARGVPLIEYQLNDGADALATAGAKLQPAAPPEEMAAARWRFHSTRALQRMLLEIAVARAARNKQAEQRESPPRSGGAQAPGKSREGGTAADQSPPKK